MSQKQFFDNIYKTLLTRCAEYEIPVDEELLYAYMHLLARDTRLGIIKYDAQHLTICRLNAFIDEILNGLRNPLHTPTANIKLTFAMKTCKELELSYVKEKYENEFQRKLKVLIDDILQYPETSNKLQLDQLFEKMQIFIVSCYNLGSPKNHVLLKYTAQSLNSVIGRSDIQNYVLKKKYHRLEYLQRLAATVGGILIFNNAAPDGDRENTRDLLAELKMALDNTKESLDLSLQYANDIIALCQNTIKNLLNINMSENSITYLVPIEKLQRINQYTITYSIYKSCLSIISEKFEKTAYLMDVEKKRFDCVVCKINEKLKMRTAIDSELIFPHFVYLSQVWATLNSYLEHLIELNKIKDVLDTCVPKEMENLCKATIAEYAKQGETSKYPQEKTFFERLEIVNKIDGIGNFCKLVKTNVKNYCTITLVLTNGLLLPASTQRKLCKNLDIQFGFLNNNYAKYAEQNFEKFILSFKNAIFTNAQLALLLGIADEIIEQNIQREYVEPPKVKEFETQTEMVIENDLSVPNWINVTWNVWDYHRETIHLADIRKRQTRDAQSSISFGKRNAQNQTYNARGHME